MNDLDRFREAQANDFATAYAEIRSGRKRSHWIWYIFPQLKGLGYSYNAQYYGIKDAREAREYLGDEELGGNLRKITRALTALECSDITDIMGYPDDLKLRSCMTLFARIAPEEKIFKEVLDKFFKGEEDSATVALLKARNE